MCQPHIAARADDLLAYDSVRFLRVKNWRLGLTFWTIRIAILIYVVVASIIVKKGYQEYDTLDGAIAIKVKGSASTGTGVNRITYDATDLVQPATEPNALFLATALLMTPNQTRGICNGNDQDTELCTKGCTNGTYTLNGIATGVCHNASVYCEVEAWCPTEGGSLTALVDNLNTWTAFVRVSISFPNFGITRTNIEDSVGLKNGFNLFTIDDIIKATGNTYAGVRVKGAIILVSITYDCDFDHDINECTPEFKFRRIDPAGSSFSSGFNYRAAIPTAQGVRTQVKYSGLRILFSVAGTGAKFGFIPLMVTFGAGASLLTLSSIVVDFLLKNCLPERDQVRQTKYQALDEAVAARGVVEDRRKASSAPAAATSDIELPPTSSHRRPTDGDSAASSSSKPPPTTTSVAPSSAAPPSSSSSSSGERARTSHSSDDAAGGNSSSSSSGSGSSSSAPVVAVSLSAPLIPTASSLDAEVAVTV